MHRILEGKGIRNSPPLIRIPCTIIVMGIRKHFEQQKDIEDLKIHEVGLDEQEKEKLRFDPETEILDTDWQGMKDQLEQERKNGNWQGFAYLAMRMSILRPDQKTELNIDDIAWQGMRGELGRILSRNWFDFISLAMHMSILRPDQKAELNIDGAIWKKMKNRLKKRRNTNAWYHFAHQALCMFILRPDQKGNLDIDDIAWQGMKGQLEQERNDRWWRFTDLALSMFILRPDQREDLDIDISAWRGMRNEIEQVQQNNWWNFADLAMSMTILSAEKVEITDQGIELVVKKPDFRQKKAKRPERKSF